MLATHDAVTTNSRSVQQNLGKLVNQGWHAAHTASLEDLPETTRPAGPSDPLGDGETKSFAKARYRSLQGEANACLRVRPTDSLHVLPAAKIVGTGRPFMGIEESVAVGCPYAVNVDIHHPRICPKPRAQANQHQPFRHAIFPHVETVENLTLNGERRTVQCRPEVADGHSR